MTTFVGITVPLNTIDDEDIYAQLCNLCEGCIVGIDCGPTTVSLSLNGGPEYLKKKVSAVRSLLHNKSELKIDYYNP